MNRRVYTCFLAAAAILVGLTSFAVADHQLAASPFAGTYSGQYNFKSSDPNFGNQQGTITLTILAEGLVTGKLANTTIGATADGTGSVDEDGGFKLTVEFTNQVYTLKGTIVKTKSGRLKGTLIQYSGSAQAIGSVEFDIPSI